MQFSDKIYFPLSFSITAVLKLENELNEFGGNSVMAKESTGLSEHKTNFSRNIYIQ